MKRITLVVAVVALIGVVLWNSRIDPALIPKECAQYTVCLFKLP